MEGTIVITDEQISGRGQRGNSWEAAPNKNLTFSLLYKPIFLVAHEHFFLNTLASLAISDTLQNYLPDLVQVKWPNDIYVNEKKIAGILIETSIKNQMLDTVIIGCGININQDQFKEQNAISCKQLIQEELSLQEVLELFCENIEKYYLELKEGNRKALLNKYYEKLLGINEVRLFNDQRTAQSITFEGMIKGCTAEGLLIIQTNNGEKLFNFKEISFLF